MGAAIGCEGTGGTALPSCMQQVDAAAIWSQSIVGMSAMEQHGMAQVAASPMVGIRSSRTARMRRAGGTVESVARRASCGVGVG